MSDLEPITRAENFWVNEGDLEPITRKEQYIKHLYDETQVVPEYPKTREEYFINKAGEELHDVTIEQLTATENRTYSEEGVAYSPVIVNVPQTTLTTLDVTENGTYTAPSGTAYNEVDVDVPLPENAYLLKDIPNTPSPIATFTDGAPLPMPKLEVAVEPQQEGSGDPSPENVRPISGWTEEVITRTGKNLFTNIYASININLNNAVDYTNYDMNTMLGNNTTNAPNNILTTLVGAYLKAGTYTIKNFTDGIYCSIYRIALAGDVCKYSPQHIRENGYTFTTTKDGWSWFLIDRDTGYDVYTDTNFDGTPLHFQIEKGDEATTYEPYNGQTITIPFQDSQGNPIEVYGGYVDLVSGVLTLTHGYIASYNGETLPSTWISDRDVYAEGTTPTIGAEVCYELATPTTIQLTPTAVKSLLGTNNLWANTGDVVDGQYFSKEE